MKFESVEKEKERFMNNCLVLKERKGFPELLKFLETTDFFEAPASTRFHGCHKGGLMFHSNNVAEVFHNLVKEHNLEISTESVMLCGLFHDICKTGMYPFKEDGSIGYVKKTGHALRSIEYISKFVELTGEEKEIIKYHMGYYGCKEFSPWGGEYTIKEICTGNNNFLTAVFHYADMFASRIYDAEDKDGI